ncbi:MAG: alkaline phosphatase D family protein [Planctomycetota bacterium]
MFVPARVVLLSIVAVFTTTMASAQSTIEVASWRETPDRRWPGPNIWANRLEDWSVRDGRLVCEAGFRGWTWRTAHLLSQDLAKRGDDFRIEVDLVPSQAGRAGLLVAAGEGQIGYRKAAMVQGTPGLGGGFIAVWNFDEGGLSIRDFGTDRESVDPPLLPGHRVTQPMIGPTPDIATLTLRGDRVSDDQFLLTAEIVVEGEVVAASQAPVPANRMAGNIALASMGSKPGNAHAFRAWRVGGERVATHRDRGFGPVAGVLYSVANGELKVGVQCVSLGRTLTPPRGDRPGGRLAMRIERRADDESWQPASPPTGVSEPAYYALLRVADHDTSREHAYRVVLNGTGDLAASYAFDVPAEPTDDIVIAGVSCTGVMGRKHAGNPDQLAPGERFSGRWTAANVWMPFDGVTIPLMQRHPDIVFFTGDQLYEANPTPRDPTDGFPVEDFLYKWLIWHWSFQDVTRSVPCILQTDDHDVWHPNIWGDGGRLMTEGWDFGGGYLHSELFVNLVQRAMCGANPDPHNPGPLDSGITNYFTTFTYGDVDFAVLEDRKFKSAQRDNSRQVNPPELLGNAQLEMIEQWANDPEASSARVVVSQTNYVKLSTGGTTGQIGQDKDTNAWPKQARDKAVNLFADSGALLFTGDQHLASVAVLETDGDGVVQFCQPAGGCIWWRWFYPNDAQRTSPKTDDTESTHGSFADGFNNRFDVLAVANPAPVQELARRRNPQRHVVNEAEWEAGMGNTERIHRGEGFAVIHIQPEDDLITLECWPDGADIGGGNAEQYPDWPIQLRLSTHERVDDP